MKISTTLFSEAFKNNSSASFPLHDNHTSSVSDTTNILFWALANMSIQFLNVDLHWKLFPVIKWFHTLEFYITSCIWRRGKLFSATGTWMQTSSRDEQIQLRIYLALQRAARYLAVHTPTSGLNRSLCSSFTT